MSPPSAIESLVAALMAVPEFDNPLNPLYAVLGQQRPLTLQSVREHTQSLHDHADQARDQTAAVQQVIQSCITISPTPLPNLPLGF